MLPQWPWVVWATTLQFPSNDAAIADGQMVAEAAARAMAQIRLPIIGVLLFDFVPPFRPMECSQSSLGSADCAALGYMARMARATMKFATTSRGCGASGKRNAGAGNRPPLQRNTFGQRLCVILAEDRPLSRQSITG
jgi:hypothetical protein